MSGPKVVKRYANRKLYDTERSCYVTLDDIAGMIKNGDDVRVVDNKSGEDLTSVTLAQIIFEAEKKASFMPLTLLRNLIQQGGDTLGEIARESVDKVQAKASEIKEQAEKLRQDLGEKLGGVIGRRGDKKSGRADDTRARVLGDLVKSTKTALEDLKKGFEEKVEGSVGTMQRYAHLGKDMDEIRKRLETLEQRLEKIQ